MLIKNVENLVVPKYLNEEFFINALEEGLRAPKIVLHEINFEWGSNPGENYCSEIYRVLLTYDRFNCNGLAGEKEKVSIIVKTIPIVPDKQFLEDTGVFLKEKIMYCDVLPRLQILGKGDKFGANCFYTLKQPVQTIVFNDLKVEGFRMASRQDCLDWNHSKLLLEQLAKFHATSMVLAKKDPKIVDQCTIGMLSKEAVIKTDTFNIIFGGSLKYFTEVISKWPGYENVVEKLRYYHKNFQTITPKFGEPKPGDRYTVLNHGDMWTNNFMFAYEDSKAPQTPTKAIFVDYQLSFYGSPGCDINFFLNTSVQLDILENRRNDLIEAYYAAFSDTLQYMRYDKIPTLEDLKYELRSRELYGLFALYGFLPIVTMPKEISGDSSIESFTDEEFKRKKMEVIYSTKKVVALLKFGVDRLNKLGVFDELC